MRQLAPETSGLDRIFGFVLMTAAGRRVLEADPGIMDPLEGGEVVRTIRLGELLATEPGCTLPRMPCWKTEEAREIGHLRRLSLKRSRGSKDEEEG